MTTMKSRPSIPETKRDLKKKMQKINIARKELKRKKRRKKKKLEITEKIMIAVIFCNEPGRNKKKQQDFPPP